jgi:hypothetical protein
MDGINLLVTAAETPNTSNHTKRLRRRNGMKKRVPLTFNFNWSNAVGYAEVDTEKGEVAAHISTETEQGGKLYELISCGMVRACSLSFELDARILSEEEMKAIISKFDPLRPQWMNNLTIPTIYGGVDANETEK